MAQNVKNARKIDDEKSSYWALMTLGSIGVSAVGVQLFHLVNLKTPILKCMIIQENLRIKGLRR